MAAEPNGPGGLDAGEGEVHLKIDMQPKSDADWKPTAVFPEAQKAVEDFSRMPKATDEQIREQFRRNREQRLRMENGSPSSNGLGITEK